MLPQPPPHLVQRKFHDLFHLDIEWKAGWPKIFQHCIDECHRSEVGGSCHCQQSLFPGVFLTRSGQKLHLCDLSLKFTRLYSVVRCSSSWKKACASCAIALAKNIPLLCRYARIHPSNHTFPSVQE